MNIGLMTVSHIREPFELAEGIIKSCEELILEQGHKVISSHGIISSQNGVSENIKHLIKKDADALVVLILNWIEPPMIVQSLFENWKLPLIIWGLPETDKLLDEGLFLGSSSASAVVKSALEQMDYRFQYIMGLPDEETTQREINEKLINIKIEHDLKRSRMGLIGYNSMGIYTTTFDQLAIKKQFGVEIDTRADSYIVVKMMEEVTDQEVAEMLSSFTEGYDIGHGTNESMIKSIKMYIALKRLIKEGGWNSISVKCQHEFTSFLRCAACLPLSILTDEGVMCSDEGDVHAALTMLVVRSISNETQFFGDIYPYNHEKALMGHCGLVPHSCSDGCSNIKLVEMTPRISKDGKTSGGIISSLNYKPGEVTLARIEGRRDKGYVMHIARGKAKSARSVGYGFSNVEISFSDDAEYKNFFAKQVSNHYIMIYDKIGEQLESFCEYNGIQVIKRG